jgi:hypothetical protein
MSTWFNSKIVWIISILVLPTHSATAQSIAISSPAVVGFVGAHDPTVPRTNHALGWTTFIGGTPQWISMFPGDAGTVDIACVIKTKSGDAQLSTRHAQNKTCRT